MKHRDESLYHGAWYGVLIFIAVFQREGGARLPYPSAFIHWRRRQHMTTMALTHNNDDDQQHQQHIMTTTTTYWGSCVHHHGVRLGLAFYYSLNLIFLRLHLRHTQNLSFCDAVIVCWLHRCCVMSSSLCVDVVVLLLSSSSSLYVIVLNEKKNQHVPKNGICALRGCYRLIGKRHKCTV